MLQSLVLTRKGAGGVLVRFSLFDCFHGGECRLPGTFFRMKKNLAKVLAFLNRQNTLRAQTLIAIPQKSTLKTPTFFEIDAGNLEVMCYGLKQKF